MYNASVRYDKEVSAGVYPKFPQCLVSIAQDYMTWVNEGWIDYAIPMNYTFDRDIWGKNVKKEKASMDGKIPILISMSRTRIWNDLISPEELYDRGKFLKTYGYQGVCYVSSASLTDEDYRLMKNL